MEKTSKVIFILFMNLFFIGISPFLYSNTLEQEFINDKKENYLEDFNPEYLLDTGDQIFIKFRGLNIFSKNYTINSDGEIFLPEIGFVQTRNKTLKELKKILQKRYQKFIYDPELTLSIVYRRPLSVFIKGEVNRPGLYTLEYQNNPDESQSNTTTPSFGLNSYFKETVPEKHNKVPRLFDALQLVQGLTNNADLSRVIIRRRYSEARGGGYIKATINLLELLETGNQENNIQIFDGDTITINRTEKILLDQLIYVNKTNLTPDNITVFVNGNVPRPGKKIISQNSSLIEAVAEAGGKNINTGIVEFIRFNQEGALQKSVFNYKESSSKGGKFNPILMNGDIIVLRKNLLGKTTVVFESVAKPILSGYGLIKIFD